MGGKTTSGPVGRKLIRLAGLLAAVVLATAVLSGCSSSVSLDPTGATIIDVRTADEYAAGHLKGAINIDIYQANFMTEINKLPKDGKYIVYCKSGVRAGNAKSQMDAAGFKDVTSAGGIDDASKKTGLPIVK